MKTELLNEETMPAVSPQTMDIAISRQAQEVQAAMVIAQKFPRNQERAIARIMTDCKRKTLAEQAVYAFPRGDTTVTGPSIRLAEVLARAWGNLDFGTVELERKKSNSPSVAGESVMMAYCWDLETNVRQTKVFSVKHWRDTKRGGYKLEDERDVYEVTANQASRRLRACILGVIPGDVVDMAIEQCEKTVAGGSGPLIDRVRQAVMAFQEVGVDVAMLEKKLKHKLELTTEPELKMLRQIYTAIRDNVASREDYFAVPATETQLAQDLNARMEQTPTPAPAPVAVQVPEAPTAPEPERPKRSAKKPAKTEEERTVTVEPAPQEPEPGSFDSFEAQVDPVTEMMNEPTKSLKSDIDYGAKQFTFGKHVGKKVADLSDEEINAYMQQIEKSPSKSLPEVKEMYEAMVFYTGRKGVPA